MVINVIFKTESTKLILNKTNHFQLNAQIILIMLNQIKCMHMQKSLHLQGLKRFKQG